MNTTVMSLPNLGRLINSVPASSKHGWRNLEHQQVITARECMVGYVPARWPAARRTGFTDDITGADLAPGRKGRRNARCPRGTQYLIRGGFCLLPERRGAERRGSELGRGLGRLYLVLGLCHLLAVM